MLPLVWRSAARYYVDDVGPGVFQPIGFDSFGIHTENYAIISHVL